MHKDRHIKQTDTNKQKSHTEDKSLIHIKSYILVLL